MGRRFYGFARTGSSLISPGCLVGIDSQLSGEFLHRQWIIKPRDAGGDGTLHLQLNLQLIWYARPRLHAENHFVMPGSVSAL